ncbi:MAG TPA: FAD-dependent oxidoreductase, partial [Nocardioidaceae bacterium]|nr:FAD-dependent oxidoreductase [Nocardioidaceae bacterium]
MVDRLVVVGASLAGLRAVEAARRVGYDGSITLIGAEPHLPYDRPPLSKAFQDPCSEPLPIVFRDRDALVGELGVDLRLGTSASGLDLAAREVLFAGGRVSYDALVIATGASARQLPGTEGMSQVHTLRT